MFYSIIDYPVLVSLHKGDPCLLMWHVQRLSLFTWWSSQSTIIIDFEYWFYWKIINNYWWYDRYRFHRKSNLFGINFVHIDVFLINYSLINVYDSQDLPLYTYYDRYLLLVFMLMNRFLRIFHLCTIVFNSNTMQLLYTNDVKKDILQVNIPNVLFLINNVTVGRTKKTYKASFFTTKR